jgi:hypothetical protein
MLPSERGKGRWRDRICRATFLHTLIDVYFHAQELCNANIPGSSRRRSEARHGLAPARASPKLAEETASPFRAAAAPLAAGIGAEVSRRREHRRKPERREDMVTADIVDVGLLFARVFGRHHAENFFRCTVVTPHVYQRILLGQAREPPRPDDAGDLVPLE